MAYGTQTTNSFNKLAAAVAPPVLPAAVATPAATTVARLSNPPFALARTSNPLITRQGQDAKMVRGYIRRDPDPTDPTSVYRLNFMYNPESIQRSYISYLDQGALDPYNTIYQAGNLVVPPGILDFSFELMFDRQIEATRKGDRGVGVDYDYFERVIRAVDPALPASINTIPDNGVLMVNPRTTTVVFSEGLVVQGKINNAVVSYDRFTHEMVPTRMRIGLQMKVVYVGPNLPPDQSYDLHITQATSTFAATVPYDNQVSVTDSTTGNSIQDLINQTFNIPGLNLGSWSGDQNGPSAPGGLGIPATPGAPGPVGNVAGYSNPLRDVQNLHPSRIDQGVDYTGHGNVYAIGNAVMTYVNPSGWGKYGAFMSYRLLDGPAAGKFVYFAEHIIPRVQVGQKVNSGTVICELLSGYPYCETGWAASGTSPTAAAHSVYHEGDMTAFGVNFDQFMQKLGAPAGTRKTTTVGALPAGWPSW